jgi:hypothetical protein
MKRRYLEQRCRKKGAFTALAILAALMAAGCGGGSSKTEPSGSSRPPGESVTVARLIAQADPICRRLNVELAAAARARSSVALATSALRNAALERTAVAELSKLTPPAALAQDWRQILEYRRTLAEELVKLGGYAKANDTQAIKALAVSKKRVHKQLFEIARRDGFAHCSRVSSGSSGGRAPSSRPLQQPLRPI